MGPGRSEATAVCIVADAFPEAGLGHLSRSSAIAAALCCKGLSVECLALGAEASFDRDGINWIAVSVAAAAFQPAVVLVVDSYRLTAQELAGAANVASIVLLHDSAAPPPDAALVVSVAGESGEGRLAGTEYAALRASFWGLPRRVVRDTVRGVLVTTGASTFQSLAAELADRVAAAAPDAQVTLVLGPQATVEAPQGVAALKAPDSLLQALLDADLVVTAGGQTMLEAAATGAPTIVVPVVENQRRQVATLAAAGAVRVVDPHAGDLAPVVDELTRDVDARRELSRNAQRAVDGYGALRVAFEIARLVETGS